MYTGIVQELGEVAEMAASGDSAVVTVRAPRLAAQLRDGDSIAIDGVCLTVVGVTDGAFTADVMAETLHRSSLSGLMAGSKVNLELPLSPTDRFGGHIVQGHVDGTGELLSRERGERWDVVWISVPETLERYVVEKGSIAIDGISLTVAGVEPSRLCVSLIPTTLERTTLGAAAVGDRVNLEVDVIAKYIVKYMERLGAPVREAV